MATLQFTERQAPVGSGAGSGMSSGADAGMCRIIRAGRVSYRTAWERQVDLARQVREGSAPETLLLLEHPHTYTKGRLAPDSDLLLDAVTRAERGIDVVETDRGGLITYHGPGQLVAYPIIRLRGRGGPHWYVRALERIIMATLTQCGLTSTVVTGLTGVWTADGQRKLAAIGVKIAGGVAYHGFAINVDPDLKMFDGIVPCGISDRQVTSLAAELGAAPDMETAYEATARQFCAEFGLAPNSD